MDNKLSELSKPVAWAFKDANDVEHASITKKANLYGRHDFQPLYSQEYVSALLADNEALKIRVGQQQSVAANNLDMFRKADERAESLLAELEAKDKRIAELEAIATEYAGKFQKAQDAAKHLVIMNDSAQAEIAHLKALLATPVVINLPERRDNSYDWDGAPPSEAFNTCRSICGLMFRQQLRAAGFTAGDE
ncbi:TPA: hypothetical protein ACXIZC_002808 [Serratia marcescens]